MSQDQTHCFDTRPKAELLRHMLTKRFGPLPADLDANLRAAGLSVLDRWAERLFTAKTGHEVFA